MFQILHLAVSYGQEALNGDEAVIRDHETGNTKLLVVNIEKKRFCSVLFTL